MFYPTLRDASSRNWRVAAKAVVTLPAGLTQMRVAPAPRDGASQSAHDPRYRFRNAAIRRFNSPNYSRKALPGLFSEPVFIAILGNTHLFGG
jgi:hypothetical protein